MSMMRSEGSSEAEPCLGRLIDVVEAVAVELRRRGLHISTSQLVDAVRVAVNYSAVRGLDPCRLLASDELGFVLSAVFARRPGDEELVAEAVKRYTRERRQSPLQEFMRHVESDLRVLNVTYGSRIRNVQRLVSDRARAHAYARLKLLGIIRRTRHGERVVSRSEAVGIARSLLTSYGSYRAALEAMAIKDLERGGRRAALLGQELTAMRLEKVNVDSLLALARSLLRQGELSAALELAKRAARRIAHGERVRDVHLALELLRSLNLVDRDVAVAMIRQEPSIAVQLSELVDMGRIIPRLAHDVREHVVAQLVKSRKHAGFVLRLLAEGAISVYDLKLVRQRDSVLAAAAEAAQALDYIARALSEANPAYLDMAAYTVARLERGAGAAELAAEVRWLRTVVAMLERGDVDGALRAVVARLQPARAIELLYAASRSTDRRVRAAAQRLLAVVASRLRRSGAGARERVWGRRGHLDLRKALRLRFFLSGDYNIAVSRRGREKVVLVLDKSGSMRPYALACVMAAASFAENVSRIVLFDSRVYVMNVRGRLRLQRLLDSLFAVSFEGYTDVARAVAEATRAHPPSKLVLISDLRQTVAGGEDPRAAIERAVRLGWRVYILAPPTLDRRVIEGLRGVRVSLFSSELELTRSLRRLLQ